MSVQPIEFSWISNEKAKSNLKELSKTLGQDEHFEVDQTNHAIKIVKSEGFSKLIYYFQEKRKNEEVKALVRESIIHLANELPGDVDQQKQVRTFFLERMAPLSHKIFDRRILGDDQILNKKLLPQILNPKLAKLDEHQKLQRRIEKTKLALNLGVELMPISQGASGAYFARDHKMKIIGVFKPGSEESTSTCTPKLVHRIKNAVLECLGDSANSSFWPRSGYVSEKLTTVLADHLNIDVIPRSEITTLVSDRFVKNTIENKINVPVEKEGSYQIFSPNTHSADEFLKLNSMGPIFGNILLRFNTWRYKDRIVEKISQSDFEKMAITDGLILNKDRHFENWLVKKDVRGDGTHEIVLIDNQLAFPKVNPSIDNRFYRRLQNKWAALPQAEKKFEFEIKRSTAISLQGENLKKLLADLQKASLVLDDEIGEFNESPLGDSQALAFKQRVAVLLYAFEKDITIKDYAAIKSLDEMIAFVPDTVVDITDIDALDAYLGLI